MHRIGAETREVHRICAEAREVHRVGGERTDPEHGVGRDRSWPDLGIFLDLSDQAGHVDRWIEVDAQEPGALGLPRVGLVGAQLDAGDFADPLDDLRR